MPSRLHKLQLVTIATLSPLLIGGCAELRDALQGELVTALENAVRSTVDAEITDFFDQYQSNP